MIETGKQIQEIHHPEETDATTWSVWILPEIEDKPTKYSGVVDVARWPDGVVRIAYHDGVQEHRKGEIVRLRQEGLDG